MIGAPPPIARTTVPGRTVRDWASDRSAHPPRGTCVMSIDPQLPVAPTPEPSDGEAAKRADVDEDRRRQRELDDGELGGEA